MIRSMTAFARTEGQSDWGQLSWELRSVNHRYLEISPRLPEEFRALETKMRERIGKALGRGKLDCTLRFRPVEAASSEVRVNRELVQNLLNAARDVAEMMDAPAAYTPLDVMRWPGALEVADLDMEPIHAEAMALLEEALEEMRDTREREGERMKQLIEERLNAMAELVTQARTRRPLVVQAQREKLLGRLAELKEELDQNRLEQEMALMAQKLDVEEELDRLEAHIDETRRVLGQDKPVGRRLDFLMQEFNREANTLGSKSNDPETTRVAVDMKVYIEQMREQVQNIE